MTVSYLRTLIYINLFPRVLRQVLLMTIPEDLGRPVPGRQGGGKNAELFTWRALLLQCLLDRYILRLGY